MPIPPTIGRIILVESHLWKGQRAAILSRVILDTDGHPVNVRANIMLDMHDDGDQSASHDLENTHPAYTVELMNATVYGPDDTVAVAADGEPYFLGRWMPYQMGQAARTDELKPAVTQLQDRVESLEQALPQGLSELRNDLQQLRDDFTAAVAARSNLTERMTTVEKYLEQQNDPLDGKAKEVSQTFNTGLADRVKDAVLHLAEVLAKPQSPGHPRQNLFSQCARIIDGKPFSGEPAEPEPVPHTPSEP